MNAKDAALLADCFEDEYRNTAHEPLRRIAKVFRRFASERSIEEKPALERGYELGLRAAAYKALNYADACGGSGEGGEGYRNLANAILGIDPKKGY